MKKTLILCFIHGFKGGEDTFGDKYRFTDDLRAHVAKALPKINVNVLVYPKYETRGNLGDTVSRFRTWLEEKVIDIEVAAGTSSPTVDPSVRTILIGHSMGGIVAAETVIGLTSEKPIYSDDGIEKSDAPPHSVSSLMFPYVQGILTFDTPFLGISPGVVAHGAEGHYQTAAAAVSQLSGLGASLWGAGKASQNTKPTPARAALPSTESRQAASSWGTWGKVAVAAGAAGAVAAGGAAAWMNRGHISEGWSWASSHLEFVGCLARGEELKKRVAYMVKLHDELDIGFANLYTRLGRGAPSREAAVAGTVLGPDRTFCNLPSRQPAGDWKAAVNEKAKDETVAHMTMFEAKDNPGYDAMVDDAKTFVVEWLQNDWYESSNDDEPVAKMEL